MDRRKFCKLASLAALGTAFRVSAEEYAAPADTVDASMPRCRVTVLRRQCFHDLQSRYLDDPETGCCQEFTEGQTFEIGRDGACPEGFCPGAWECISRHVKRVIDADSEDYCGLSEPDGGAVIACCNDGTRPVIFKIERL